jgi:hypothetical protein
MRERLGKRNEVRSVLIRIMEEKLLDLNLVAGIRGLDSTRVPVTEVFTVIFCHGGVGTGSEGDHQPSSGVGNVEGHSYESAELRRGFCELGQAQGFTIS